MNVAPTRTLLSAAIVAVVADVIAVEQRTDWFAPWSAGHGYAQPHVGADDITFRYLAILAFAMAVAHRSHALAVTGVVLAALAAGTAGATLLSWWPTTTMTALDRVATDALDVALVLAPLAVLWEASRPHHAR